MESDTPEVQQALEESLDNVGVLAPRSSCPEDDDLITPGEFDIV